MGFKDWLVALASAAIILAAALTWSYTMWKLGYQDGVNKGRDQQWQEMPRCQEDEVWAWNEFRPQGPQDIRCDHPDNLAHR